MIEHQVWAKHPGKKTLHRQDSFTSEEWQFAVKCVQWLKHCKFKDVQIRDVPVKKPKPKGGVSSS